MKCLVRLLLTSIVLLVSLFSLCDKCLAVNSLPTALYNPNNGNITFINLDAVQIPYGEDYSSGEIWVESPSSLLLPDNTNILGLGFGGLNDVSAIIWISTSLTPFSDASDAGNIVTPGTSATELSIFYVEYVFVPDIVQIKHEFFVLVVPEQSTIVLLLTFCIITGVLRRQR